MQRPGRQGTYPKKGEIHGKDISAPGMVPQSENEIQSRSGLKKKRSYREAFIAITIKRPIPQGRSINDSP